MLSTEQESITEQLIQAIRDGSLEEVKKKYKKVAVVQKNSCHQCERSIL